MIQTCETCRHFLPEGSIIHLHLFDVRLAQAQCTCPMPFAKTVGAQVAPVATWEGCPCWRGGDA
jgi:hypothetical protein